MNSRRELSLLLVRPQARWTPDCCIPEKDKTQGKMAMAEKGYDAAATPYWKVLLMQVSAEVRGAMHAPWDTGRPLV